MNKPRQTISRTRNSLVSALLLPLFLLAMSSSALAHHPLDGVPMQFFWHGLLSGVAHPVLGIDHLLFIIAIAVTSLFSLSPVRTLGVVIFGVFTGVALASLGVGFSWVELAVALSLVALGVLLLSGLALADMVLLPLLSIFSVFHGYAYGQALTVQADLPIVVVLGFLAGLPLVYAAIAFGSQWVTGKLLKGKLSADVSRRLVGATVAVTGLVLM